MAGIPANAAAYRGHGQDARATLLVDKGAELDGKDASGNSPVDSAKRNHHREVADYLRSKGAKERQ